MATSSQSIPWSPMELITHSRSAAAAADFSADAALFAAEVDSSLVERLVEASVEVGDDVERSLEEFGSAALDPVDEVVEGASGKDVAVSTARKIDSAVMGWAKR